MKRAARVRAAAELATIQATDRQGRVKSVSVPGHTVYRKVLVSRISSSPYPVLAAECLMVVPVGLVPCKGNWRTVCYHGLGAVECAVTHAGAKVLHWLKAKTEREAREKAVRLVNLKQFQGARLGCVVAKRQGRYGGRVWFLWREL